MRVPLSWLSDHVGLDGVPAHTLADKLTFAGLEIEAITHVGADVGGVITARVLEVRRHPDADRLALVRVDAGRGDEREVVCGAHNYRPGDIVPLASPGAKLPGGVEIGRRKVRGVWSDGMLASPKELGVLDDHSGILLLPPDTPVGADVVEAIGLRDTILEIKTFPNRGDTLSIRGVAREAALALGTTLRPLDATVPEAGPDASTLAGVEVLDGEGCPVYTARVIEGVDGARLSPLWLARRLYLYGQRPLGAVVDVTNYLLIDVGQPLHAFDLDRVPGRRIVVRRARDGETLTTLDGRERRLTADDTLITDGEDPLALAGIMGGASSEVSPKTTRVLLEAAHFPPASVRRTMRRLGMNTEGGQRWARGVDPEQAAITGDRAARLIAELAGGVVARGRLEDGPGAPPRPSIRLDWPRSANRLGAPAQPAFAKPFLEGVGCRVEIDGDTIVATPPSWRFDLEQWADLEEEVARRWGYDQIPATLPKATGGRLTAEQRHRRRTRDLLGAWGLVEVNTEPFTGEAAFDALGLAADDPRRTALRVANPLSEETPLLRTTLLPGMAEVARRNLARGLPGVALFELASVFLPNGARAPEVPDQPLTLGLLLAGRRPAGQLGGRYGRPGEPYDFADIKGLVEALADRLGVDQLRYIAEGAMPFHPGRCAGVTFNGDPLGLLGQLHPRVTAALGLPAGTFAAELWIEPVMTAVPGMRPAPFASPFPEATIDVAFLVPPGVAASRLEATLWEAGGDLLTRLELFDAYEGDPLPAGYRNLAYRVVLQSADRTLSDADAIRVRDRMEQLAGERLRAELRTAS
jgi:phenylalanyl-tRNA synthetase beta chain